MNLALLRTQQSVKTKLQEAKKAEHESNKYPPYSVRKRKEGL